MNIFYIVRFRYVFFYVKVPCSLCIKQKLSLI